MMPLHTSSLFRPFGIKSPHVKDRIVMAPMTRISTAGGVGLILSEGP